MKTNKLERAAGKLVAVVLAVMAVVLSVFFVFGNNILTVI